MPIIDLTQNLNNVNFITILFLFVPGYVAMLFSNYLLRKNDKPPYLFKDIDKWELILWFGLYSLICYLIVSLINWFLGKIPMLNKTNLNHIAFLMVLYLISIVMVGIFDYFFRSKRYGNRSNYFTIAEQLDEKYKKCQSFVWVKMKTGEKYNGLFLGIDYNQNSNSFIMIGQAKRSTKILPILKKFGKSIIESKSKTAVFNLDEVESILFEK